MSLLVSLFMQYIMHTKCMTTSLLYWHRFLQLPLLERLYKYKKAYSFEQPFSMRSDASKKIGHPWPIEHPCSNTTWRRLQIKHHLSLLFKFSISSKLFQYVLPGPHWGKGFIEIFRSLYLIAYHLESYILHRLDFLFYYVLTLLVLQSPFALPWQVTMDFLFASLVLGFGMGIMTSCWIRRRISNLFFPGVVLLLLGLAMLLSLLAQN